MQLLLQRLLNNPYSTTSECHSGHWINFLQVQQDDPIAHRYNTTRNTVLV